jgi:hypothetical protein
LGDWNLIERSEAKIIELCTSSSIDKMEISIIKDSSGLTNIVEVTKTSKPKKRTNSYQTKTIQHETSMINNYHKRTRLSDDISKSSSV